MAREENVNVEDSKSGRVILGTSVRSDVHHACLHSIGQVSITQSCTVAGGLGTESFSLSKRKRKHFLVISLHPGMLVNIHISLYIFGLYSKIFFSVSLGSIRNIHIWCYPSLLNKNLWGLGMWSLNRCFSQALKLEHWPRDGFDGSSTKSNTSSKDSPVTGLTLDTRLGTQSILANLSEAATTVV